MKYIEIVSEIEIKSSDKIYSWLTEFNNNNINFYEKIELICHYRALLELIEREYQFWSKEKSVVKYSPTPINNLVFAKSTIEIFITDLQQPTMLYESLAPDYSQAPDFLNDEQIAKMFGWAKSTVSSKRSRGELPKRNGMGLTAKKQLFDMLTTDGKVRKTEEEFALIADEMIKMNKKKR